MKKICLLIYLLVLSLVNCKVFQKSSDELYPFPDSEGKWGYVDANKNTRISFDFDGASPFFEDRAFVAKIVQGKEDPIFSIIDRTGKILFDIPMYNVPEELWQMDRFRYKEGLLGVATSYDENRNDLLFYDKDGKVALTVPGGSTGMDSGFSEGLACIQFPEEKWKYIDKKGNTVLEGKGISPIETGFNSGWAVSVQAEKEYRYTLINKKGETAPFLKSLNPSDISAMHEGYSLMEVYEGTESKIKLLKSDGTIKSIDFPILNSSPVTTTTGYNFHEGLALVHYNSGNSENYTDSQGYLNTEGKLEFSLPDKLKPRKITYNNMDFDGMVNGTNFNSGLAAWKVEVDDTSYQIYYINKKGKVVLESPVVKKK